MFEVVHEGFGSPFQFFEDGFGGILIPVGGW